MKVAKTMGQLRAQCAEVFAGAISGKVDEKRGRLALKAAAITAELYQAETRSRLVAAQLKEAVTPLGEQSLGESPEDTKD